MIFLLDTDHISILQRRTGPDHDALRDRISRHPVDRFAFSVVSFHEQVLGAHTFLSRAKSAKDVVRGYRLLDEIIRGFSATSILPFDAEASAIFEDMTAQRIRVATMDLRIAAIALAHNAILLTRNARDFDKVPSLATEYWTA